MSNLYSFDDHPEHRDQLDTWARKWIANALSTEPANQPVMVDAINGLYEAANLPRPLHIAFVRSPLAMAVAGGVAAGVWWLRGNPAHEGALFGRELSEAELMGAIAPACAYAVAVGMTGVAPFPLAATGSATRDATRDATRGATRAATDAATRAATDAATRDATGSATRSATWAATADATDAATWAATWAATADATDAATRAATEDAAWGATRSATWAATLVGFLVRCSAGWWKMQDGGSDWSSYPSYLSFFKHVAGLELPVYEKWRHYEEAALNGGQRVMHEKFCIISDRHTEIHLEPNGVEQRLHREDGPAKVYGDGWALNYWHGIAVPYDFFTWDIERALAEKNSEVRRCAIERLGWENVTDRLELVAEAPDPGNDPHVIRLYDLPRDLADLYDAPARILVVENASLDKGGHRRVFGIPVPATHEDPVAAAADLFGVPVAAYRALVRAS